MAVVNWMMSTTSKKNREMLPGKIYDSLLSARTADKVTLHFKDGRVVHGALIFNPFKGTGRVINITRKSPSTSPSTSSATKF
jgi:hypothetical protein